MNKTFIIVEIGACHDGQYGRMKQAVGLAKTCGADACKFQWTSDPRRMAARRGDAAQHGYARVYRRYLNWPASWHAALRNWCDQVGLAYMCTAYLPEDVAVVASYVAHFKVASFEAESADLIEAHLPFIDQDIIDKRGRLLFVSMGMGASYGRLGELVRHGTRARKVRLLHCVSAYPAPAESLNLCRMWPCRDWGAADGFSDHSDPALTWTGALAVAAGATVVEAHLRLPSTLPSNPDFAHAMTAEQLTDYVRHIRFAETCLGDGQMLMQDCERQMAQYRCIQESEAQR